MIEETPHTSIWAREAESSCCCWERSEALRPAKRLGQARAAAGDTERAEAALDKAIKLERASGAEPDADLRHQRGVVIRESHRASGVLDE